jgi:hypothetical protein
MRLIAIIVVAVDHADALDRIPRLLLACSANIELRAIYL